MSTGEPGARTCSEKDAELSEGPAARGRGSHEPNLGLFEQKSK